MASVLPTAAPLGTGQNRGAVLFVTSIVFGAISLVVVVLRIGYRLSRGVFTWSDACIVLAIILNLMHSIVNSIAVVDWGWGQHEADLPIELRNAWQGILCFWIAQFLSKPCLLFTKLSVFFVYHGLFHNADSRTIRICRGLNYFTAGLVVTYYTSALIISIFECTPNAKMWYPTMPGTCIDKSEFFYATGVISVVTSSLLITIPLPVLTKMKTNRTEVAQLLGLILLGLIDTITSIVRMFTLASAAESATDFSYTIINSVTATAVEMSIAIIAASLVVMRPLFQAIYRMVPGTNRSRTYVYEDSQNAASKASKSERGKLSKGGITKTVEIEMEHRSVSQEGILGNQHAYVC